MASTNGHGLTVPGPNGDNLAEKFGERVQRFGQFDIPHVITFSQMVNTGWQTYRTRFWDKARAQGWEEAQAMENDPFLMSLLQERIDAMTGKRWHVEVDNERDPWQKAVKDGVTSIVKRTYSQPMASVRRMQKELAWALWFGRHGSQVKWEWQDLLLPMPSKPEENQKTRALCVAKHVPVRGDKIEYRWDGTPVLLVNAVEGSDVPQSEAVLTESGKAIVLLGSWRQRFVIHCHERRDADFLDVTSAAAIHGLGLRSISYWASWMRHEWLSWISDFIQRCALGQKLWYYQAGNKDSFEKMKEAAQKNSNNVNILVPRFGDSANAAEGVDVIDTPTAGAVFLLELIKYFDQYIERLYVGQTLSANTEGSGLGGTGVASMHASTKWKRTAGDVERLDETLSADYLEVIKRWTYPWCDFPVRWVSNLEDFDPEQRMNAIKTARDMGIDFKANEVRELTGTSDPVEGDNTLDDLAAKKQAAFGTPGLPEEVQTDGEDELPQDDFEQATPFMRTDALLRYGFDESQHPRDDAGEFVSKGVIDAARSDPAKAQELRSKVTDPKQRRKLEAMLGGHGERAGSLRDAHAALLKQRKATYHEVRQDAEKARAEVDQRAKAVVDEHNQFSFSMDYENTPEAEYEQAVMDYDADAQPAEKYEQLKAIESAVKKLVGHGLKPDPEAEITEKEVAENKAILGRALQNVAAAKLALRRYVAHRREMKEIRTGEWKQDDERRFQRDQIPGGKADSIPEDDFDPEQLAIGTKHEMEHTNDRAKASEIARDHLAEDADYYRKLKKMEVDPEDDADDGEDDDDEEGKTVYQKILDELTRYARDASGHEHKGKGEGGGQFTSAGDHTSSMQAMPHGSLKRIGGWMTRRTEKNSWRIDHDKGHVEGGPDEIHAHIAKHAAMDRLEGKKREEALARDTAVDLDELEHGTRVVSKSQDTYGRMGTVVETPEGNRVKLDNEPGYASPEVEPLEGDAPRKPKKKKAAPAEEAQLDMFKPTEVQRTLFKRSDGRWITIGASPGPDGKKHGGTPVYVEGGRITKGHPKLTGKKIDALSESSDESSHRSDLHRSKEYNRAVWGKKARKEGLDPNHLHQLAADIIEHDKAHKEDLTEMLKSARKASEEKGMTNLKTLRANIQQGDKDHTHFKGLDQIAQEVSKEYPHHFRGHEEHPDERLFDLLSMGNPVPMEEDEAYEHAFNHLMENRAIPVQDEPVPFQRKDSQ